MNLIKKIKKLFVEEIFELKYQFNTSYQLRIKGINELTGENEVMFDGTLYECFRLYESQYRTRWLTYSNNLPFDHNSFTNKFIKNQSIMKANLFYSQLLSKWENHDRILDKVFEYDLQFIDKYFSGFRYYKLYKNGEALVMDCDLISE